jgi:hypothetical protein
MPSRIRLGKSAAASTLERNLGEYGDLPYTDRTNGNGIKRLDELLEYLKQQLQWPGGTTDSTATGNRI